MPVRWPWRTPPERQARLMQGKLAGPTHLCAARLARSRPSLVRIRMRSRSPLLGTPSRPRPQCGHLCLRRSANWAVAGQGRPNPAILKVSTRHYSHHAYA